LEKDLEKRRSNLLQLQVKKLVLGARRMEKLEQVKAVN